MRFAPHASTLTAMSIIAWASRSRRDHAGYVGCLKPDGSVCERPLHVVGGTYESLDSMLRSESACICRRILSAWLTFDVTYLNEPCTASSTLPRCARNLSARESTGAGPLE